MPRPIAFDLTRLHLGGAGATPRGIDRVDMSFARHLFDAPGAHHLGLVPTPAGMGVVRAAEARRLAAQVERHWRENRPADDDAGLARVRARLAGDRAPGPEPARGRAVLPGAGRAALQAARLLLASRGALARPAARAVPHGAAYVNTGQVLLGSPGPFRWLASRPDVKAVMLIHDLIPVLYPEYSGPILARRHARALEVAARHATAMLATSEASADEIRAALRGLGRADMPFHVVPLPVSASLLAPGGAEGPGAAPYFVTVGIVDQRKNHRLLLHVWREIAGRAAGVAGAAVPPLVVIGARGLRTGGLMDFAARSPALRDTVVFASGLSSPAVRDLIRGARALLMPSFTEGFGLPVAEALALGVPVVASDIPAHREVGGAAATYLDPLDGLAWARVVAERAGEDPNALARRRALARPATPPQDWDSYFAAVMPFLESL